MANKAVRALLDPKSIAIVGASDRTGPGLMVSTNALSSVANGTRVYLINPSRDELFGAKCYKSLAELPEVPDTAVFVTSTKVVLPTFKEAAELGIPSATVLSAGFSDSSLPEGAQLQAELQEIAAKKGMAICGPNCNGVINFEKKIFGVALPMPKIDPGIHKRNVALISQTGGLLIGFLYRAESRSLPLRYAISGGNEAVTGIEEYMEEMLEEDDVTVIACICEGFRDIERFLKAARACIAKGKQIGMIKVGASVRGVQAVKAHTGKNAGDRAAMVKRLQDAGISIFERTDELVEFSHIASRYPRPKGPKVAAFMVSGGCATITCDLADKYGIPFAEWPQASKDELKTLIPDFATVSNPLDTTGGTMIHNYEALERVIRLIGEAPETDYLAFVFPMQPTGGPDFMRKLFPFMNGVAQKIGKPLAIVSTNSGTVSDYWASFTREVPCAIMEDADTAFKALAAWSRKI